MEKKLIEDDINAKLERYTEFVKDISNYEEILQHLTPIEPQNPEEIKQIHDKFSIDFSKEQA